MLAHDEHERRLLARRARREARDDRRILRPIAPRFMLTAAICPVNAAGGESSRATIGFLAHQGLACSALTATVFSRETFPLKSP